MYAYDALGCEVRHTTPWNAATKTSYDGLLIEVTDALGNLTIVEHDALGRTVDITDAAKGSRRTRTGHSARLNLSSRTDALQPQHTTERFRYDAPGALYVPAVVNASGVVVFPDDPLVVSYQSQLARYLTHQGPPPSEPSESTSDAAGVGAGGAPTDVDTTGSSPEVAPEPVATEPDEWTQDPYLQIEGRFLGGLAL